MPLPFQAGAGWRMGNRSPEASGTISRSGSRVLVIDDNADLAAILAVGLTEAGFACTPARTLADAHRELARAWYDVVVADIRLPDGDGASLSAAAAARGAQCILITGDPGSVKRLNQIQATYLKKPFTLKTLVKAVAGAC